VLEHRAEHAVRVRTPYVVGHCREQEHVGRDLVRGHHRHGRDAGARDAVGEARFLECAGQGIDGGLAADADGNPRPGQSRSESTEGPTQEKWQIRG
jgi:hypothetical protein